MQNTLTCEPIDLNNIMEISSGVRKGMWSKEEDDLLRTCIQRYGEGKWHLVPQRAGNNINLYLYRYLQTYNIYAH